MSHRCCVNTPFGRVWIAEEENAVTGLFFEKTCMEAEDIRVDAELCFAEEPETDLLRRAGMELMEYLRGERRTFDLPLAPKGTEFQRKVWEALRTIPYGETRSYRQIAEQIGNPKACRAVGGANNKNPIMIFIPCHRVVGADGALVGFGGGVYAKKYMLELERKHGT